MMVTGSARQTQEGQGRLELTDETIAYTTAGNGPVLLLINGLGGLR
jgi:hypothetical protein